MKAAPLSVANETKILFLKVGVSLRRKCSRTLF